MQKALNGLSAGDIPTQCRLRSLSSSTLSIERMMWSHFCWASSSKAQASYVSARLEPMVRAAQLFPLALTSQTIEGVIEGLTKPYSEGLSGMDLGNEKWDLHEIGIHVFEENRLRIFN